MTYFEPDRQAIGKQNEHNKSPLQSSLGKEAVLNMAASVCRVLSFSRSAKVLASPLRLTAVPVYRYSLEVSSTGEAITHTGQVSLKRLPLRFTGWPNVSLALRQRSFSEQLTLRLLCLCVPLLMSCRLKRLFTCLTLM